MEIDLKLLMEFRENNSKFPEVKEAISNRTFQKLVSKLQLFLKLILAKDQTEIDIIAASLREVCDEESASVIIWASRCLKEPGERKKLLKFK